MLPVEKPFFPDLSLEIQLWAWEKQAVAGIDEAGRGALAGPVSAAAVILPPEENILSRLDGVRDSKLMRPAERCFWAREIKTAALAWMVGYASAAEIDRIGILPATRLAMSRAINRLAHPPAHLLLDYVLLPDCDLPQTALIKGDRSCLSIAAASVLAKTERDARLAVYDRIYPGYSFAQHKGYGTAKHRAALNRLGPSPIHRRCFNWKEISDD